MSRIFDPAKQPKTPGIRELPGVVPYGAEKPPEPSVSKVRFSGSDHFFRTLFAYLRRPSKQMTPIPPELRDDFRRMLREVTAHKPLLQVLMDRRQLAVAESEKKQIAEAIVHIMNGKMAFLI